MGKFLNTHFVHGLDICPSFPSACLCETIIKAHSVHPWTGCGRTLLQICLALEEPLEMAHSRLLRIRCRQGSQTVSRNALSEEQSSTIWTHVFYMADRSGELESSTRRDTFLRASMICRDFGTLITSEIARHTEEHRI